MQMSTSIRAGMAFLLWVEKLAVILVQAAM